MSTETIRFENLPNGAILVGARRLMDIPHRTDEFIVLCHLPHDINSSWVTWRTSIGEDGVCSAYFWGNYFSDGEKALSDFCTR